MKITWYAMLIALGPLVAPLAAAPTPYDFTGHWSGTVIQQGQSAPLFADFAGTQTFSGTLGTNFGGLITCMAEGKQKKRVIITLICSDGSKAKIKSKLDPTTRTLSGKYRSSRPGHRGHHGTFTMSNPGACVPTGQDCTDPATGGGEAAVCCNGDCHGTVNPDSTESHACN